MEKRRLLTLTFPKLPFPITLSNSKLSMVRGAYSQFVSEEGIPPLT